MFPRTELTQETMRSLQASAAAFRGMPGTVEVILYATVKNYEFASMGSAFIQYTDLATLASESSKREIEKAGDRILQEQIQPDFRKQHPEFTAGILISNVSIEINTFPQN